MGITLIQGLLSGGEHLIRSGFWRNLTQNGRPNFEEKTFSTSQEIMKMSKKNDPSKRGFDKQPAGMYEGKVLKPWWCACIGPCKK